jgi:hypothetical protein
MPFPCCSHAVPMLFPCRSQAVPMPFPCCSPTVPLPCRSAKALDCVFPIWFTLCGRVWFAHAMPFHCRSPTMPRMCLSVSDLSRPWQVHGRVATAGSWHIDGMLTACSRLASLWPLLLPRPVPGSLLSEAYQYHIAVAKWPVWNRAAFVIDEKKLIILVKGHECLYNLQHKDYDNNLVKDNCWKEIAELHAHPVPGSCYQKRINLRLQWPVWMAW